MGSNFSLSTTTLLSLAIIATIAGYYMLFLANAKIIYFDYFVAILSLFFVALVIHLYRLQQKLASIAVAILLSSLVIFYLTDNPPIITFKVTPENPKSVNEIKVEISAEDDRCLKYNDLLEITGFPTARKFDSRIFTWLPRIYCLHNKYEKIVDFTNWPDKLLKEEDISKLEDITIKLTLEDSLGQTTMKQIIIPLTE